MATKTHSYSSFLRTPSQVLPDLVVGDVVLERRDEESLVVTRQDRFEAMRFGMAVSARMLRMLSKTDPESVANLMTEQMPWLGWLPTPERVECLNEILFNLDAGAETGPWSRSRERFASGNTLPKSGPIPNWLTDSESTTQGMGRFLRDQASTEPW
jgi:hypothetical protein